MRIRMLAAAGVLVGIALTGTAVVPAHAVPTQPAAVTEAAAGWATSIGGPIRSCAAASCGVVYQTSYGQDVYWDRSQVNSAGNRWYHVTSPATGWIYCGNISAPC
ncbi:MULTISPECIES: hypothetical protein [Streptomyces]|uniref:hypothetical protein n=1 Tax=Streptomyces TaxID=1883 RepID=UPI0008057E4F|nr:MULTISPECIES: hypothetical protein [unclassified Streptomyces]MYT81878.1 hypothetical protein [Streptomyces sp. SID8364]SBV07368.1 hypothetical protein YW3DRAFT_03358 [Streptomyces sp. MnatMP-M77]SCD80185.1 hypothetical protein GA0115261_101842 [Streptomyces sp. OspMP-M43]